MCGKQLERSALLLAFPSIFLRMPRLGLFDDSQLSTHSLEQAGMPAADVADMATSLTSASNRRVPLFGEEEQEEDGDEGTRVSAGADMRSRKGSRGDLRS